LVHQRNTKWGNGTVEGGGSPSSCCSPCARSKRRVLTAGRLVGGCSFGRLLCNRFYRGEVIHRGTVQPGKHKAIVDGEQAIGHPTSNSTNFTNAKTPAFTDVPANYAMRSSILNTEK
jgi:hypothetical protein